MLIPSKNNTWNEVQTNHNFSDLPYLDFPKLKVISRLHKSSNNILSQDDSGRIGVMGNTLGYSKPKAWLFTINSIASICQDILLCLNNSNEMVYTPSCLTGFGK